MKRFKTGKAYLVCMSILTVFIISGCSGGDGIFGGGHWNQPGPLVSSTDPANNETSVTLNKKVAVVFTWGMDPATITGATFSLKETVSGAAVAGAVTYSGVTAVFSPTANLAASTKYTGIITIGARDTGGRALQAAYTWSFTTGLALDTTPPTVTGTINANGAANVAVNSKVGATFSEGMNPATITGVNLILKETVSGTAVAGTVSYSGVSAVFSPSANLAFSTNYTVTVKGGVGGVADLAGNAMVADYVWSWTTGVAPDTTPPTVTGTIHTNGQINVAVNTAVGATFSEAMDPLTITNLNFTLKQTTSGTAVAGTVSYSGVSASFIPLNNLSYSTNYTVTVKGGVGGVADLAGNPMVADFVISWTTGTAPDTTPPTVTGTINANGATNVAVNTKAGATFSEGMNPLTITNQNFTLKQTVSGTAVAGTVSYSGVSALFTPAANLAFSTSYTGTIKGGVGGVADLAGNLMVADYVWSWTTGVVPDTTAPTVIGTINANGATNVAVNTKAGATFSEAMDILTVTNANFMLKETVSGAAVAGLVSYSGVNAVFTPTANLANSTSYTVTIKGGSSGVKDLAGNPMAVDYVWSWTTGAAPDTTRPTVTLVNPADLATNVATSSAVNATFSKAMNPLTISTASFKVAGVTGLVTYNALTNIATFTPSAALAVSTTYTATVTTAVADLAGNTMLVDKVWSFTTAAAPVVPPVVALGTVSTYGTFGGSAGMTNQGILTIINGNIGTIATGATSVTGFHDTEADIFTETGSNIGGVNGTIYTCTVSTTGPNHAAVNAAYCALATQARLDAQTAYLFLAAMPSTGVLAGNLAGTTINPGVYTNASSVKIEGGDLTLDALGDANAVFVFQIGSTLTVGGPGAAFPQSIILANGAQAKNVFWQIGTFATINAGGGGTMVGTIITSAGVSFSTVGNVALVTLNGRALSLGASVTMTNTVINVPAP